MSIWSALVKGANAALLETAPAATRRVCTMKRLPPKPLVAKTPVPPPPKPEPEPVLVFNTNPWRLSPMQWQVLAAVALSKTTRHQIAHGLHITEKTMDTHLSRIRERMGVQTTAAAVADWLRVNMERDLEEQRAASEAVLIERLKQYA